MAMKPANVVVPPDLRAKLDELHALYGRNQQLAEIISGLNTRFVRAREMYGPQRSLPEVVTGICDKLDNVRRLYSRIYGYDLSMEEILDIIMLHARRLSRLVELQSQTRVSSAEQEEIEFLRRMTRRYVYELASEKAAQRAAMAERAEPIIMPTASVTASTNGNGAAPSSPANTQKKAQSRSIAANMKTAKSSLER